MSSSRMLLVKEWFQLVFEVSISDVRTFFLWCYYILPLAIICHDYACNKVVAPVLIFVEYSKTWRGNNENALSNGPSVFTSNGYRNHCSVSLYLRISTLKGNSNFIIKSNPKI